MIRATEVRGQHRFTEAPADTVVLDFDDRHRRRMAMTGTRGLAFLLDLETAVALRGGDALVLEDGRLVEVVAAPEPLLEIRGRDPHHLIRVGWHLGNRHLPTQIMQKALRIRRDHVIEAMVKGLGARVVEIEAPFDPEGGAYADGGHAHGHDDHAHHRHAHDHGHHDHAHHDHQGHDHHDHAHHDHKHHDHADHGHHHHHHHDAHCDHPDHHHGHPHAHDRK
jgi:urease accessory protein